jgi:hypothetical protein
MPYTLPPLIGGSTDGFLSTRSRTRQGRIMGADVDLTGITPALGRISVDDEEIMKL